LYLFFVFLVIMTPSVKWGLGVYFSWGTRGYNAANTRSFGVVNLHHFHGHYDATR